MAEKRTNGVFSYYRRLTARQKGIYRASDATNIVPLPAPQRLRPWIGLLAQALTAEDRAQVTHCCQAVADGITQQLRLPAVRVKVLAKRPSNDYGELHGLYESAERRGPASITLWMRTAQRRHVVAFKSFLRTLLHELCHHLDYARFRFADSFHTAGFYRRESSLFHQLVGDGEFQNASGKKRRIIQ